MPLLLNPGRDSCTPLALRPLTAATANLTNPTPAIMKEASLTTSTLAVVLEDSSSLVKLLGFFARIPASLWRFEGAAPQGRLNHCPPQDELRDGGRDGRWRHSGGRNSFGRGPAFHLVSPFYWDTVASLPASEDLKDRLASPSNLFQRQKKNKPKQQNSYNTERIVAVN